MLWWIAGGVVFLLAAWTFNRLVRLRARSRNAWSDIDVQLKRRWDLVPGLVATVKGYAGHEAKTLERVVAARNEAGKAGGVAARGEGEASLSNAVRQVFALVEAYPDLKANESFLELQASLVEIEDKVQYARRYYNAVVRDLNTLIASFPSNLVASLFGFGAREYFQLDDAAERRVPEVDL